MGHVIVGVIENYKVKVVYFFCCPWAFRREESTSENISAIFHIKSASTKIKKNINKETSAVSDQAGGERVIWCYRVIGTA